MCKTYVLALTSTMCFEVKNSRNKNRDSLRKGPFVNYVLKHVGVLTWSAKCLL